MMSFSYSLSHSDLPGVVVMISLGRPYGVIAGNREMLALVSASVYVLGTKTEMLFNACVPGMQDECGDGATQYSTAPELKEALTLFLCRAYASQGDTFLQALDALLCEDPSFIPAEVEILTAVDICTSTIVEGEMLTTYGVISVHQVPSVVQNLLGSLLRWIKR